MCSEAIRGAGPRATRVRPHVILKQSTLQLMPPLTIEPEEIAELLERPDAAVAALAPRASK